MKTISQQEFIELLIKEVDKIYEKREKMKPGNLESVAFGHQLGLLYVIDQLREVYKIK